MSLTAYERETVISMNDEDDFAIITTYQRPRINKLRVNPGAEIVAWLPEGGMVFKVPAKLVTIRDPRPPMSAERREQLVELARQARERIRDAVTGPDMQQPLVTRMEPI